MMNINDNITSAINDFELLFKLLEKKEGSEVGKSFRSRCRELPALIEDIGLIPALSFCYAKATESIYKIICENINYQKSINDDRSIERGYAIYLYLVLKKLNNFQLISNLDDPIVALEELKGKERIANRLLRSYIIQMKRLSEAIFKGGGEEI